MLNRREVLGALSGVPLLGLLFQSPAKATPASEVWLPVKSSLDSNQMTLERFLKERDELFLSHPYHLFETMEIPEDHQDFVEFPYDLLAPGSRRVVTAKMTGDYYYELIIGGDYLKLNVGEGDFKKAMKLFLENISATIKSRNPSTEAIHPTAQRWIEITENNWIVTSRSNFILVFKGTKFAICCADVDKMAQVTFIGK